MSASRKDMLLEMLDQLEVFMKIFFILLMRESRRDSMYIHWVLTSNETLYQKYCYPRLPASCQFSLGHANPKTLHLKFIH